jgi:hypothetical protein
MADRLNLQLLEERPGIGVTDEATEDFHYKEEKHGQKGSPVRKPLVWQIFSPGVSFMRTFVLAVERRADI